MSSTSLPTRARTAAKQRIVANPRLLMRARQAKRLTRVVRWGMTRRIVRKRLGPPRPAPCPAEPVTLFWCPEASIAPHLEALVNIARVVRDAGQPVAFVRCHQVFERCQVMEMHQLRFPTATKELALVCDECAGNSFRSFAAETLDVWDLRGLVTPQITRQLDDALGDRPADLTEFTFDGVAFGKLALHDVAIGQKLSSFDDIDPSSDALWLAVLRSVVLSYLVVDSLCADGKVSHVVHFDDYAMCVAARLAASKHGVGTSTVQFAGHRNVDHQRYLVQNTLGHSFRRRQIAGWPQWRDLSLGSDEVRAGADDVLVRLGARGPQSHVYSPPKTTGGRTTATDSTDRHQLVAFTSSLDEVVASQMYIEALSLDSATLHRPFPDQIEWLHALVAIVAERPQLDLVVRIHPREGTTRREKVSSDHLRRLREHFDRPIERTRFVWPGERVSSYDLAESADLALTSWSSMGVELARLGLPVVASTCGIGPFPSDLFIETAATPSGYADLIDDVLTRPPSLEAVILAYRWYWMFVLGATIDLGDVLGPDGRAPSGTSYRPPRLAATLNGAVRGTVDPIEFNRGLLLAKQHSGLRDEEEAAVRGQLARITAYLLSGRDPGPHAKVALRRDGGVVRYDSGSTTFEGTSRMIQRLMTLISPDSHQAEVRLSAD